MAALSHNTMHVVVAGCGPAGRWLAAALSERGLDVMIVSPTWDTPWQNRYAGWEDELAPLGVPCDVRLSDANVHLPETLPLGRAYVRADRDALRADVDARLGRVVAANARVTAVDRFVHLSDGERVACDVFVDATGAGQIARPGHRAQRFQTAYGVEVSGADVPLPRDAMTLMDFRSVDAAEWAGRPSFLYAMPLSEGRWFFEETILVGAPVAPVSLRGVLAARLASLGVDLDALEEHDVERCVIPMDVAPLDTSSPVRAGGADGAPWVTAFGAAAGYVHPATGYSLATTLRRSARVAEAIEEVVAGRAPDPETRLRAAVCSDAEARQQRVYGFGGEVMASMSGEGIQSFFGAFFSLEPARRDGFLAGTLDEPALARAMWEVFLRTSMPVRGILAGAGFRNAPLLWRSLT